MKGFAPELALKLKRKELENGLFTLPGEEGRKFVLFCCYFEQITIDPSFTVLVSVNICHI